MPKARPKTFVAYQISTFDGRARCFISCYPQQVWEYCIKGNSATLNRKGVSLTIPKEDFERQWKVVE